MPTYEDIRSFSISDPPTCNINGQLTLDLDIRSAPSLMSTPIFSVIITFELHSTNLPSGISVVKRTLPSEVTPLQYLIHSLLYGMLYQHHLYLSYQNPF